jgi:hypothetical protein
MQPDAKGLWLMDFATAFPAAQAGLALPLAHALVGELARILLHLRRQDAALARPLRSAALALPHALVSARLATRKAHAGRHLARAGAHAREVYRLLALAEARRYFVPGPRTEAVALARRLLDRLPPAA